MAEPFQTPRLDSYAQDLLRQSYGATPISPDILAQYGQGMAQQVQAPPQVQQYSGLRPSQERQQYIGLIEQRLNQLAEAAGGMQELIDTGIYDQVRQKAERDVKMMYGDIPAVEKPPAPYETFEVGGRTFARGGIFGSQVEEVTPQKPEEPKPSEAMNTVVKKSADFISTVDPMLGQLEAAIAQTEDPNIDPATKLSSARTIGKLINSLQVGSPDAVGAEEARALLSELNENILNPRGLVTSETVFGTNLPQFTEKMKLLRDRVAEQYNKQRERVVKADPTLQDFFQPRQLFMPKTEGSEQMTGVAPAPGVATQKPTKRVFVPGKGFQ